MEIDLKRLPNKINDDKDLVTLLDSQKLDEHIFSFIFSMPIEMYNNYQLKIIINPIALELTELVSVPLTI